MILRDIWWEVNGKYNTKLTTNHHYAVLEKVSSVKANTSEK